MTQRYLGHKSLQGKFIVEKILRDKKNKDMEVGDLFSGTGEISLLLKKMDCRVHANDYLKQCELQAAVKLFLNEPPLFKGIGGSSNFYKQSSLFPFRYAEVLDYLLNLPGIEGFIYREYSPEGSLNNSGVERKYFTNENAKKIDSIRLKIKEWKDQHRITSLEHALLLVNLIEAVNDVANISGTYGCFLKKFEKNALKPLRLTPIKFIQGRKDHTVTNLDVCEAAEKTTASIIYLDPPFTKRQYITYYHIPETIALENEPAVSGKTGIPYWSEKASEFCYKSKALNSLKKLIDILWPREIYLSYSSDGHMTKDEILSLLNSFGETEVIEYNQKRFKSNNHNNHEELKEYLFHLKGNINGQYLMAKNNTK